MKPIITLISICIIVSACGNGSGGSAEAQTSTYQFTNFEELALDPCLMISEDLVLEFFDVDRTLLQQESRLGGDSEISRYSYCIYNWSKPNADEINKANQERMMAAIFDSDISVTEAAMQAVSPSYQVGVASLHLFDDEEQAVNLFTMNHQIPTEEAMEEFRVELDQQLTDEEVADDSREIAGDLSEGIASKIKFTSVEEIGDLAVWDHLDKRLVVLAGRYQFGVTLDYYESPEENIELAKRIAARLMEQF